MLAVDVTSGVVVITVLVITGCEEVVDFSVAVSEYAVVALVVEGESDVVVVSAAAVLADKTAAIITAAWILDRRSHCPSISTVIY